MIDSLHSERLSRARASLEGLSVGDAFGEKYFGRRDLVQESIRTRRLLDGRWRWTDDTNMALSVYSNLRDHGRIEQDTLAAEFARHFDSSRGYGPGARRLLTAVFAGTSWREAARSLFGGDGSFGNGAAMRVTPLGAYFADDITLVVENAWLSAEVTHAHPEGIAGAIAVAIAAAFAWQLRMQEPPTRAQFLDMILPHIPESDVKQGVIRAREIRSGNPLHAADMLGNGSQISAQDTVPFVLWCAGEYLSGFTDAMWATVSGLGDRDTTCAMVGGIVVMYTGVEDIPAKWLASREPLPGWAA